MESKNVFQRMLAITDELRTVAKNLMVDTGSGKGYKAVSERDIIYAVKPLEAKHGVYSYPYSREILEAQMLETETKYGKKSTFFTRIKTVYRFVNVDKPDEYIDTTTFSEGIDPQDKGSGKAMTYADKYALMKAYKISTGDDPDQKASEDVHYTKAGRTSARDYATEATQEPANDTPGQESENDPEELATDEEKTRIKQLCKALEYKLQDILNMVGIPEGGKMTKGQYEKAARILQSVSEKRFKESKNANA